MPADANHTQTIDAHHHLWHYSAAEYGWLDGPLIDLRRDFLPADLQRELPPQTSKAWTAGQLYPYLDTVVSAFEPTRLMAGSDWPVCLAGVSYKGWWDLLRNYFADFNEQEQQSIFNGCASRAYRLDSA